jgi:hypothetical protein
MANAALAAVRGLDRDLDILTTLRDRAGASHRDSNDTTGTLRDLSQLLGRMNPFSYPNFEPFNLNEPSNSLKRMVTPRTMKQDQQQQHSRENMSYAICALPVRAKVAVIDLFRDKWPIQQPSRRDPVGKRVAPLWVNLGTAAICRCCESFKEPIITFAREPFAAAGSRVQGCAHGVPESAALCS